MNTVTIFTQSTSLLHLPFLSNCLNPQKLERCFCPWLVASSEWIALYPQCQVLHDGPEMFNKNIKLHTFKSHNVTHFLKKTTFIRIIFIDVRNRFTCVICIIYRTLKYFTNTTTTDVMVGGKQTEPRGNPQPFPGCWKTVPSRGQRRGQHEPDLNPLESTMVSGSWG